MTKSDPILLHRPFLEESYFPNLDGLRFLCFLSVFFFHSFHTEYEYINESSIYYFVKSILFKNGNLGVNFFFVLSGFLITFLLLREKKQNGQIHIINFWRKRILRIWPLFYACVFFGFFIFPILKTMFGQHPNETANLIYYLTFLNNFDFIEKGLPDASVLGVLWSVAIEEQFYFIWPLLIATIPVGGYKYLFSIIIIMTLVFRAWFDIPSYLEYHTFSCIGDMAIGGLGAVLVQKNSVRTMIENTRPGFIAALYCVMILVFFFRSEIVETSQSVRIFERSIVAVLFLCIILEQNYAKHSLFKLGDFKLLSKLGTITYGLYCLHFIGILITTNAFKLFQWNNHVWQVLFMETFVALMITIMLAAISYRYFELPFLRLKEKFSYLQIP